MPNRTLRLQTQYYQQFDADLSLDVPGEGYAGWKTAPLDFDFDRTALVVMHAWETGTAEQYPGWYRAVEYIPRAQTIARDVFPPLLTAVRKSGMTLYHVISGGHHNKQALPGYERAVLLSKELGFKQPEPKRIDVDDPNMEQLNAFRRQNVFVGPHNVDDCNRGMKTLTFDKHAIPQGEEGVAEDAQQLAALCQADGITHLVYVGFAINWCLLMSPGGMLDMSRHGLMCSAIRQATTAVENKETARNEINKAQALWRVALAFGFVFDVDDFKRALAEE
jgi:nicotinamidase-related amidase